MRDGIVKRGTEVFQIGMHILRSTVTGAKKTILLQLGNVAGEGVAEADGAESWQHDGFVSLPPTVDAGATASEAFSVQRGERNIVIASRDLRGQELAGSLAPGETCVYAAGADGTGQARILLKANGSISLYTTQTNQAGGPGMAVIIDPSSDSITMLNSKGYGLVINADGVSVTAKKSGLKLASSGDATLVGTGQTQVDGGGVLIGSQAVPGANSALHGVTGLAATPSVKVLIE